MFKRTGLFLLASCLSIAFFTGCRFEEPTSGRKVPDVGPKIPATSYFSFTVISDSANAELKESILKIRLQERISEAQLRGLADDLRKERKQLDRLWIFYFIKGADSTTRPWATTHYMPGLEVKIFGYTLEQYRWLKESPPAHGKLLGTWIDEAGIMGGCSISIVERDGKYFFRWLFLDGKESEVRLSRHGERKFVREDGTSMYYLLKENGHLGSYNRHGEQVNDATRLQ